MTDTGIRQLLERARRFASAGEDEQAKAAYLDLLRVDSTHFHALNELATIALSTGHRSAARTAYQQAVRHHPGNPAGRVNLGNVYFQDGDLDGARLQYEAALAADGEFPEAHQGLARTLEELGEPAAAQPHWHRGFAGHALRLHPYRGTGTPIRVLLLVSSRYGNLSTQLILDDRTFEVAVLYADYHDASAPLPPHAVVLNAIGDADLCPTALKRAEALLANTAAPVINPPALVLRTGRVENARRLAAVPGVVAPAIRSVPRRTLEEADDLVFPLLLRSPGYHMGSHFVRVARREDLASSMTGLPGEDLLVIEHLDARGADGMTRKYRVMFIDGTLYPLHLAISADWKVHYFSAAMDSEPAFRAEEERFLEAMPAVLGPSAMAALRGIATTLGLGYAGVDFGLDASGSVLLFEANATMVIVPPPPDPIWDYRRAAIDRALRAAKHMIQAKAAR